jgi:hypothetical protein
MGPQVGDQAQEASGDTRGQHAVQLCQTSYIGLIGPIGLKYLVGLPMGVQVGNQAQGANGDTRGQHAVQLWSIQLYRPCRA